jgi:5-methylthioribose kinase
MTDDDVRPYLREHLPGFEPVGPPERLPEGNLNRVWRVSGSPDADPASVIVKHAPPHIAATPDIPLDPSRLRIEAECLQAFDTNGRLHDLASDALRPPHVLHVDLNAHVLLMEDVGTVPTLGRWLRTASDEVLAARAGGIGHQLGGFIGRLHRRTWADDALADRFDNHAMQKTRHAVQYQAVGDLLQQHDVADAEALGDRAEALGRRFLRPGRCLVMGDLWPPSVLVDLLTLRLIDWELAHFGRPEQDLAHIEAHLWMQAQRAPSDAMQRAVRRLRDAFRTAYRAALGEKSADVLTDAMRQRAAVHFGAEILVRTVGAFQDGYLYAGLSPDHPDVQAAVRTAARALREPIIEAYTRS